MLCVSPTMCGRDGGEFDTSRIINRTYGISIQAASKAIVKATVFWYIYHVIPAVVSHKIRQRKSIRHCGVRVQ